MNTHLRYNADLFPLNFSERLKSNLKKFSDYKSIVQRLKETTRRFGSETEVIQFYLESIWPNRKRAQFLLKKIKKLKLEEHYEIRPYLMDHHFEYLLIDGRVLALHIIITKGNMLQVVGLSLVPNSDVQEYEVEISAEIQWEAKKKIEHSDLQFLRELDSVQDHVADPIEQWTKFLSWQEEQIIKNQRTFLFKRARLGKKDELLLDIQLKMPLPTYILRSVLGNEFSIAPLMYSKDKNRWVPIDENIKLDPVGFIIKFFELKKLRSKKNSSTEPKKTDLQKIYRIIIDVDEDYLQEIKENPKVLADTGFLISSIAGDIAPLKNQIRALERFSAGKFFSPKLATIIFDGSKIQVPKTKLPVLNNTLQSLNERQFLSVKKALASPEMFLLQGPPGTGKTTVIAELAYQVTLNGGTILIASQTNLAVDNALDRLLNVPHLRPLRIGASHRVTKHGMQFLPENVVNRWLKAIIKDCESKLKFNKKGDANTSFWSNLQKRWIEKLSNPSKSDIKQFQAIYTKQANVFGMTCNEAGKTQFWASAYFKPFDIIVIDEVSKATLPELLMPMLLGKKNVLVGDHRQLPPMFKEVTFQEEVEEGNHEEKVGFKQFEELVTKSLYVTLFNEISSKLKETLTIQYRMHPEIMQAVNYFYADSLLTCGLDRPNEQRSHGISLAGVSLDRHLIWIDSSFKTIHGKVPVYEKQAGTSKLNLLEVDLVIESLLYIEGELQAQGFTKNNPKEIGVISFYGAQLLEIRSEIRSLQLDGHFECMQIRTNTVDRFQGMEKPIIILSMVRSKTGRVGDFVKRYQRINVAMSRAQELLIIIGAEKTFSRFDVEINDKNSKIVSKPVYRSIVKEIKQVNAFITAKSFRL